MAPVFTRALTARSPSGMSPEAFSLYVRVLAVVVFATVIASIFFVVYRLRLRNRTLTTQLEAQAEVHKACEDASSSTSSGHPLPPNPMPSDAPVADESTPIPVRKPSPKTREIGTAFKSNTSVVTLAEDPLVYCRNIPLASSPDSPSIYSSTSTPSLPDRASSPLPFWLPQTPSRLDESSTSDSVVIAPYMFATSPDPGSPESAQVFGGRIEASSRGPSVPARTISNTIGDNSYTSADTESDLEVDLGTVKLSFKRYATLIGAVSLSFSSPDLGLPYTKTGFPLRLVDDDSASGLGDDVRDLYFGHDSDEDDDEDGCDLGISRGFLGSGDSVFAL